MIGRLSGQLAVKQAPALMIDVNGVGYDLLAPMTTFYRLPELGQSAVLYTHFAMSETSQQLYGFIDERDRELFRLLIKVNGVGPKMAVSIMSMESSDIARCVADGNISALVKVPGVGKKTAERLIVEMRDRLAGWLTEQGHGHDAGSSHSDAMVHRSPIVQGHTLISEAESALVALGYKPAEAARAISAINKDQVTRSEDLIRLALQSMM